jgi:hypothetical protein
MQPSLAPTTRVLMPKLIVRESTVRPDAAGDIE